MLKKVNKNKNRIKRHLKIRNKIYGTKDMPRLNVFRSSKHIYAQVIDDESGKTLVSASSIDKDIKEKLAELNKSEVAKEVGLKIGKEAKEKGIEKVVFDRGGYLYHGRIKSLANGAKESGLIF